MIRAVLFDFDGTLTRPGAIDFAAIKREIGCPADRPILEYIEGLGSAEEKASAFLVLESVELEAARRSHPNDGAEDFLRLLADRGIPRGIISRNGRVSIETAMRNFDGISLRDFTVVLSRENAGRPKPDPDGVLKAAGAFGISPADLLMVGDFYFDIQAGNSAGALTAFLTNGAPLPVMDARPDFVVNRLMELEKAIGGTYDHRGS
jgi:hydrogenase expression/formation protein HypE